MTSVLFLPVILSLTFMGQNASVLPDKSSVTVVSFRWLSTYEPGKKQQAQGAAPAPEMTAANKSAARAARVNNPLIPDPNEQTIDGRSAAMEKIVQEARSTQTSPVNKFEYHARVQNASAREVDIIFWEYDFIDRSNKDAVSKRQFLCGVKIKPGKEKEVLAFSLLGPTQVINASTTADKPGNPFEERAVINRVEFSDGTIWQRRDWNAEEIRLGYKRALQTPWEAEMCRAL